MIIIRNTVLGFLIGIVASFLSFMFTACIVDDFGVAIIVLFIIAILCPLIGFLSGLYANSIEEEKNMKIEFSNYDKTLNECINKIVSNVGYDSFDNKFLDELEFLKNFSYSHKNKNYQNYFDGKINELKIKTEENIQRKICDEVSVSGIVYIERCLNLLKKISNDDLNYDRVIFAFEEIYNEAIKETNYLSFTKYGECNIELEKDDFGNINNLEEEILYKINEVRQGYSRYFENFTANINSEFINNSAKLMWFYAKKKPFDLNKFEQALNLYNMFTIIYCKDLKGNFYKLMSVEVILAKIYALNQMGGLGAVKTEWDNVKNWINICLNKNKSERIIILASGLSWLELYDFEKETLSILVKSGVQLSAELQERYGFLEMGGNTNINIYDIEESDKFIFDSSSVEWNNNDFDVFFRKLKIKNKILNYSISVSKWTKTLPLNKGQIISYDKIYEEFYEMIKDFNDEKNKVSCMKKQARAVNLVNVEYEDAILFDFYGKKNKCLSVLFFCEKFGRNLNIAIITLMTPDGKSEPEELKKYTLAIKENMYVDSFIEAILQTLDEIIVEKEQIYDNVELNKSVKKIFE